MELKRYQIHVMDDIGAYLDALDTSKGLHAAWKKYWDAKGVAVNPLDGTGVPGYCDEVKGQHLDGSDSQAKLDLGKAWANAAGTNYKYFMVFKDNGVGVTGAVKIDELLNTVEKL